MKKAFKTALFIFTLVLFGTAGAQSIPYGEVMTAAIYESKEWTDYVLYPLAK